MPFTPTTTFTRPEAEALFNGAGAILEWFDARNPNGPDHPERADHFNVRLAAAFLCDVLDGSADDIESTSADDALWEAVEPLWSCYSYAYSKAHAVNAQVAA